jgi:hypothetical protein
MARDIRDFPAPISDRSGGSIRFGASYRTMRTAGRCKGVLSCAPSVTCLFIVHSLSWRSSALEHAPFRRRSAFHIATSTIIMVLSTSLMFSPTFSATLCAGRGGIVLHTLSPPLPAFTGGGSPCVFPGRPRYSRCHELLASLRRRQTMTSGERSTPALFAGKSDMEITDASSSVFSFHWRGGTAQCDAASIRAADIGIRPVHRWVRTPSVLLLWGHAAVPGDDVRAGRVCSKPWQFFA